MLSQHTKGMFTKYWNLLTLCPLRAQWQVAGDGTWGDFLHGHWLGVYSLVNSRVVRSGIVQIHAHTPRMATCMLLHMYNDFEDLRKVLCDARAIL